MFPDEACLPQEAHIAEDTSSTSTAAAVAEGSASAVSSSSSSSQKLGNLGPLGEALLLLDLPLVDLPVAVLKMMQKYLVSC